ncbi:hypothetical protein Nans01_23510 [Nocardiopsis ansamitocini]|uniref:Uncharacterized protein n=1 Tax=Nocardiopsis ansamitocini TaxID=1670832 RepID=A0A9W6P6C2_9ACTN|nr:hypothetical protein Nans01_23510 [Nocardiopsis ansamitocini]
MAQRGDEVAQRLTGPGAGLDDEVLLGLDGLGDRGGHGHLSLAPRSPERAHRGVQQCFDVGKIRHACDSTGPR